MIISGTILVLLGIIGFILGIILEVRSNNDLPYIFLCLLIFLIPIGLELITEDKNPEPTKQDVLDGKAIYQETLVITGNDTIKTYDIVWK